MPNLHPFLIHFPIALLTSSFVFDLAGILTNRKSLNDAGWWTMLFGMLGLTAAVVTGLLAEKSVVVSATAQEHFESHQQIAFVVAGIYATLFLWRIANKGNLPANWRWWFLGIALLGVAGIWICAWHGGEMVYRFGVGVQGR